MLCLFNHSNVNIISISFLRAQWPHGKILWVRKRGVWKVCGVRETYRLYLYSFIFWGIVIKSAPIVVVVQAFHDACGHKEKYYFNWECIYSKLMLDILNTQPVIHFIVRTRCLFFLLLRHMPCFLGTWMFLAFERLFHSQRASVWCRCWAIWGCAKECFIPMSLLRSRGLVQEKDQKLFQLPLLLFCMEHDFKRRTSERTPNAYTHNTCARRVSTQTIKTLFLWR